MIEYLEVKTISELPDDLILVDRDYEVRDLNAFFGLSEDEAFGGFFVRVKDGDYDEVWGFYGTVPYFDKLAWRIRQSVRCQ